MLFGQPRGTQQQQQAQKPQIAYSSYPQQQSRGVIAPQMGGGASGGEANAGHGITLSTHQEPLNTQMLTEANITAQKQMLGKHLSAMLLLEDEGMLRLRVDEEATVLYQATGQKEAQ
ncbi:hypothetical protein niasHS_007078 [Heterodera schachtii]|uniref:Uncharacterized protein n=1 Tax=Heterodera schachtii TaxID=97005 RepID=A0ABD2JFH9_HETSC